jgi:glucose-1-phosphate thymidylyltransferase
MKAVVLAAGYGTRLRPLTNSVPKQLLSVGGRPILDWILERIRDVPHIDGVHLVTNSRFAPDFERWAEPRRVVVHDDGTTTNDDRLGAVRDLQLVVERAGLADEELLVVAGDNLFDFSLSEMADWWRAKGAGTGAVALYDCGDLELATQYGIATTNADDRIVDFVEKPSAPSSTLSATVVYMLAADHVRLIQTYISDGHGTDNIGSFLGWLAERRPVYGYRFHGRWYDIGNLEQLAEADNHLRRLVGLPERDAYEPD